MVDKAAMIFPVMISAVEKVTLYTICQDTSVTCAGVIVRRRMETMQVL